MRVFQSVIFWIFVGVVLLITFAQADGDYIKTFYFITFLVPVAVATSYFFNHFLVPSYLLLERYWLFTIYLIYTLIVSIYLELIVLTLSFITLANYSYKNLNPYSSNLLLLTLVIYLIVFVHAFILLMKRYKRNEHILHHLEENKNRNDQQQLVIRVDRKAKVLKVEDILFFESLADYVKVITVREEWITKEKISELHTKLPDTFIRVHRSFIVNRHHLDSFNKEEIQIGNHKIPISRSYKKAMDFLHKEQ